VPETDTTTTSDEDRTADDQETSEDKAQADNAQEHQTPQGEANEDSAAEDEGDVMSDPIDQGPALRDGGTLNLGICHFGGAEEPASLLASREDGTGWIAVCEEHTKDAEEQGFVVEQKSSD
jgi:hypothetical protein